jgi:transcriptional regulator with XRE-family HTH domain
MPRSETGDTPNRHTMEMGELIRKAREEARLTQEELAKKTYRNKLAVHQMESGKVEINAWTLIYLSGALKKPISYFYPKEHLEYDPKETELTDLEKELIIHFRYFESDGMRRLFIQFAKLFSKFIPGLDFAEMLYELTGEDYGFAASTFIESYYKKVLEDKEDN